MKNIKRVYSITLAIAILVLVYGASIVVHPIPSDTIQGLYHPFRDIPTDFPNGIPYKNSLITDPVRQQFPWKYEAVQQIKHGELPLWNPYSFSGTPLLANIQSGVFYPLNIVFILPVPLGLSQLTTFATQWSMYIYLQSVLGFYFMYLYLRKIGLTITSAIFGSTAWVFSGYMTAWWEWGNIGHTIIWMPLLFWSIEKYTEESNVASRSVIRLPASLLIFLCALTSSFLAGHWQSFSFVLVNTFFYAFYRLSPIVNQHQQQIPGRDTIISFFHFAITRRRFLQWSQLAIVGILFAALSSIQWLPSLEFLQKSARDIDPTQWQRQDWFFPDVHFIGLIAPDFFGNPSTQNYWGVWNYGEFAGYVGIAPLLFALSIALRWVLQQTEYRRHHNNTLDVTERNIGVGFFLFCIIINFVLITRNPLSELPYHLNLPFLSTTQPSRGIVMIDFSLAVLAAVGLHYFIQNLQRRADHPKRTKEFNNRNLVLLYSAGIMLVCILTLWGLVSSFTTLFPTINSNSSINSTSVASNNLVIPSAILGILFVLLITIKISVSHHLSRRLTTQRLNHIISIVPVILITLTLFDVGRFFLKFNTFSKPEWLYPPTPLTSQPLTRYMTDDARIFAPNLNLPYQLATVEGYDPLYFDHYGKFIGLWVRNAPDLTPYPANRMLTPRVWDSKLADLAATSHLYSFQELSDPNLSKLNSYGLTKLYARTTSLPYLTILPDVSISFTEQEAANQLFNPDFNPQSQAVLLVDQDPTDLTQITQGASAAQESGYTIQDSHQITITKQTANQLALQVNNYLSQPALLYRSESYDPGWQVRLNGQPVPLIRANFSFQGLIVPPGAHTVVYQYLPLSVQIGAIVSGLAFAILCFLILLNRFQKSSNIWIYYAHIVQQSTLKTVSRLLKKLWQHRQTRSVI